MKLIIQIPCYNVADSSTAAPHLLWHIGGEDRLPISFQLDLEGSAFASLPSTTPQAAASVYITGPMRQGTNSWWPICSAQVRRPDATSSSRSKISRPTVCTVASPSAARPASDGGSYPGVFMKTKPGAVTASAYW